MKKLLIAVVLCLVLVSVIAVPTFAAAPASKGFNQFGYNYQARVFSGPADGVDKILDGMVWGDPTYANDHLVMKWSKAWDDASFNGAAWTADAWETNEWNGQVPGGSGISETVKIIWVGAALESSQYWRTGGYAVWGEFEVIMDKYTGNNPLFPPVKAIPNGFGGN